MNFRLRRALIPSLLVLALACQDPAARVDEQRERGEAALAKGEHREAVLEFKGVLQVDPNDTASHFGLARAYLGLGKRREAFWELQETVRLDPENLDARLHYAQLLRFGGEADRIEAIAQADAVLAADEGRWQALLLKGQALESLQRSEEATAALEAAVAKAPEEAAPHYVLAEYHRRAGRRAEAEGLYRKLVEMDPSTESWELLARFLGEDRRQDAEAEAAYRKAADLATAEQAPAAASQLANFLFARDRFEEAEATLQQAIDENPENLRLVLSLARVYDAQGESQKAEQLLLDLAEAMPRDPEPLLSLAQYRRRNGNLLGALEATERALGVRPGDIDSRLQRADLLLEIGFRNDDGVRIGQGRATVDAILADDPGQPAALYIKARIAFGEGRYEEAAASLRRVLDRRSDWADAHALMGTVLVQLGDGHGARAEWMRALELDPSRTEVQQGLARLHVDLGEDELAADLGQRALRKVPDDLGLRVLVAQSLARLGQPEKAMALLTEIPETTRSAEVHYALGRLYLAMGDHANARKELVRADEMNPGQLGVLRALLELDDLEGTLDESDARIMKATVLFPTRQKLQLLKGDLALRRGDPAAAESAFRRAIEIAPNDMAGYQNLATYMMATGQPDEVIETYERARNASPTNGLVHLQLATLYESQGRKEEALQGYEKAVKFAPGLAVAKNNLAFMLVESGGDLDRALGLAQEAKAILPNDPTVSDTLGWVLLKKGIPSAAIGYLQEAERGLPPESPVLPEVRLHLALAHEANLEPDKAREVAERALEDLARQAERGATPGPWEEQLRAVAARLPAGEPGDEARGGDAG